METFSVSTPRRSAFIDVTSSVAEIISAAGVEDGIAVVFVPHTTAGVTINENADPSVRSDIINHLDSVVPSRPATLTPRATHPHTSRPR